MHYAETLAEAFYELPENTAVYFSLTLLPFGPLALLGYRTGN